MKTNKKRFATYLKLGVLLLGISVLLWNCEKDEIINEQKDLATIFNSEFKAEAFKEILPYGFSVNWSKPKKEYSPQLDAYFYEFAVYFENKEFNPDIINKITKRNYYKKYKVVVIEKEEGYSYHLASYFLDKRQSTPNLLKKEVSLNQDYSYNGILHVHNTELEKVFSKRITINKQQVVDFTVNLNPTKSNTKDQARSNCRTITTYHYRDYYRNVYDMHGNYLGTQYMYTVLVGTSTRTECDERIDPDYVDSEVTCVGDCTAIVSDGLLCPNGDPADANGNCPGYGDDLNVDGSPTPEQLLKIQQDYLANELSLTRGSAEMEWVYNNANNVQITLLYNFIEIQGIVGAISLDSINFALQAILAWINSNNTATVNFDDRIINELTGKAKCVYDKLEDNDLMKKTIERFKGDSFVNLNIKYGIPSKPNASGETTYGTPIKIVFRKTHIENRPSLFTALVILHEAIHAEIYRKVYATGGLTYTPPNTYTLNGTRADFPTLFDYYNDYPNTAHHNFMADYYRNAIEQGLRDYASVNGLTYPDQLYKDLAWIGLQGTNAWDNMYADPIFTRNEQNRIKNSTNSFINSGTNECK